MRLAYLELDSSHHLWCDRSKMNLISKLLSRRHPTESPSKPTMTWTGQSGKGYHYEIYAIETEFRPLPGNYIYARQTEDGSWMPIYVGQTRDMHQRLEGQEKLASAIENGATHIHMHYDTVGQAARCTEERDLIVRWQPSGNDAVVS